MPNETYLLVMHCKSCKFNCYADRLPLKDITEYLIEKIDDTSCFKCGEGGEKEVEISHRKRFEGD